jgi:DNA invertase Pin-like site-specific DNA recombinase
MNMKKKAIILGRVSTEGQDLDQQTSELIQASLRDGYSRGDLIIIAHHESGISLRENERKGLLMLKETIEQDPDVRCVYIYEVTRIARRGDVSFNIKQFLVDHGIQLVCLKPEFRLLDSTGEVNQMANVAFGMLSVFAEQEMYNTKARMMRGKMYAKMAGRFIGGRIKYGYSLDSSKHIIINQGESEIIKRIFMMMVSGDHSISSISKELKDLGLLQNNVEHKVYNILKSKRYTEEPVIIPLELFNKAQECLKGNQKQSKHVYHHIFLARSILKDMSGYTMIGKKRKGSDYYASSTHSETGLSISSRLIDDTLWDIVRVSYYNRELPQDLIKDIQQKIKVGNKRLEDNQEKLKRIELRFIQGKISEEMADSLRSQTKQEGSTLSKQLKRLEYQLESLKEPETVDIDSVIDPAICSKFVREVISEVKVTRESKKVYRLEISYNPPFFGPSSILLDHGKVSRLP